MGLQSYNTFPNDILLVINDDVQFYNYADNSTLLCADYKYDSIKDNYYII